MLTGFESPITNDQPFDTHSAPPPKKSSFEVGTKEKKKEKKKKRKEKKVHARRVAAETCMCQRHDQLLHCVCMWGQQKRSPPSTAPLFMWEAALDCLDWSLDRSEQKVRVGKGSSCASHFGVVDQVRDSWVSDKLVYACDHHLRLAGLQCCERYTLKHCVCTHRETTIHFATSTIDKDDRCDDGEPDES